MAKKKKGEDLDFDLDDISAPKKITEVAKDAIQKAIDFVAPKAPEFATEEEEWRACVARLKEAANKIWICIPRVSEEGKLSVEVPEIEKCTGQQFYEWLCLVYPPAKDLGFTSERFDELTYRESTFAQVLERMGSFAFPKVNISSKSNIGY